MKSNAATIERILDAKSSVAIERILDECSGDQRPSSVFSLVLGYLRNCTLVDAIGWCLRMLPVSCCSRVKSLTMKYRAETLEEEGEEFLVSQHP